MNITRENSKRINKLSSTIVKSTQTFIQDRTVVQLIQKIGSYNRRSKEQKQSTYEQ